MVMVGDRFGRLVVIRLAYRDKRRQARWECRCDCGRTSTPGQSALNSGKTTSCGHHRKNFANVKHGYSPVGRTPTYRSWSSMWTRCTNANAPDYKWYGGRGITICKRWKKFENFLADMGERPDGTTLDRKSVNGNYTPSNCRWATDSEQQNNRRNSKTKGSKEQQR